MTTTTSIKAEALAIGDTFSRKGSTKSYTVTDVPQAHRDEYAAVVRVVNAAGTVATIAFPADTTVELHN